LTRRQVLGLAAAGLVAGCTPGRGPDRPKPTVTTPPSASPPRAADWDRLRTTIGGTLDLPGSSAYDVSRLVENPRYDGNRPLGVLGAKDDRDVSTALAFAQDHTIPVAIRSGGHSYPGYSSGGSGAGAALVIDCRGLASVSLKGDGSAVVGAGAALATVYGAIGDRGRGIAGGSCATVGVGGLTQGGGVGVLVRAYGLTCDAVTSMQVVTADRKTLTVSAEDEPDLFWALRGGGGGHLGVVTSFTFKTFEAPVLHTFYLEWAFESAAQVVEAWQSWAPTADKRLWSTLKLLGGAAKHPGGPAILVSGTWTGPQSGLDAQLSGLLSNVPTPTNRSTSSQGYRDAMMAYAGCSSLPLAQCHTGPGGGLDRESFGATSHVGYDLLDAGGISDLVGRVQDAQGTTGLKEAGISMDALGGAVTDLGAGDTAFVHRKALMTVQYTATFTDGAAAKTADTFVRGFRDTMTPHWGQHAYVNYADEAVDDYRQAYFGANAPRLSQAKKSYDPDGFFVQRQGL